MYIRNTKKAKYEKFERRLIKHLEKLNLEREEDEEIKKILFKVYSDKDISKNNQDDQDSLDKLKIFVSKFYMGDMTILQVLNELNKNQSIGHQLIIDTYDVLDPENDPDDQTLNDRDLQKTILLFTDSKIDFSSHKKNSLQYYICYEQVYKNHNPFYKFEENKPAWIAPVTIPHTLLAAMMNLAEIDNIEGKDGITKILDPFGGSGTTYFEGLKYGNNVQVTSNDITNIADLLCKDNVTFFRGLERQDIDSLEQIDIKISNLKNILEKEETSISLDIRNQDDLKDAYKYVIDFLLEVYASAERQDIDQKAFEFLSREPDFFYRILFYVIYKSIYKHLLISSNENRSLNDDDKAEIKTVWKKLFINKVSNYIHLIRSLKANKENLRTQKITATDNKRHLIFNDIYSKSITINFGSIPEVSSKTLIKPRDVLNLQIEDEYDVIVTDPPYGFNTQEDIEELFKIYTQGIKKLIVALRDPGQLILSLPEHSYNGQHLYSFTQKDFLIQQIISTVQQCGKEIVNPASSLTYDRQLFRPPYYWESKRSLRRSIVHFRIRNIEKHQDKN